MKILLVDNSPGARDFLRKILPDCELDWAPTLEEGVRRAGNGNYSLILLETDFPDGGGFQFFEKLKAHQVNSNGKVIIYSTKADVKTRKEAFALGAIDYIAKSVAPEELKRRILSRGPAWILSEGESEDPRAQADIQIQFGSLEVQCTHLGQVSTIALTATEFKIFHFLYAHRGRMVDREMIRTAVWKGTRSLSSRSVDKHIVSLRRRLIDTPLTIRTINKLGYGLFLADGTE